MLARQASKSHRICIAGRLQNMISFPSLSTSLKLHRITSASAWSDRLVIWTAAMLAGLAVVGFSRLTDYALHGFFSLRQASPWAAFVASVAGSASIVWLTRRFFPYAAGSGIPQVIAAIDRDTDHTMAKRMVSIPISIAKALLGSLALLCGFSTGREGPSVQIAAGVFFGMRRFLHNRAQLNDRDLLLAGGAAGIAAAFNAPLAGIVFAIEELSKRFEQRSSGLIVTGILLAGIVAVAIEGNFTYFGSLHVDSLPIDLLAPGIMCIVVGGLVGGGFSRLLILSTIGTDDWPSRMRQRHPVYFAAACGALIALLGQISAGAANGSGYQYTKAMLDGTEHTPLLYVGVKILATWLSFWSGVPGGIFAPTLAIGAGIGNDVSMLWSSVAHPAIVAVGMVAFLAAVTQAPITAFIIVMEMTDGHSMVLSLIAAALAASRLSSFVSPPLYHSLAIVLRHQLTNTHQDSRQKND